MTTATETIIPAIRPAARACHPETGAGSIWLRFFEEVERLNRLVEERERDAADTSGDRKQQQTNPWSTQDRRSINE